MSTILIAIGLLTALALAFGALLGFAAVRFKVEGNPIVDQINDTLPQTQCGQCGYPGCKPYAEAIAGGEKINKCPPGGESTIPGELADHFRNFTGERVLWPYLDAIIKLGF